MKISLEHTSDTAAEILLDYIADTEIEYILESIVKVPSRYASEHILEVAPEHTSEITLEVPPEVAPEHTSEITLEVPPEVAPEHTSEITLEVPPEVAPEHTSEITLEVPPEVAPEHTSEVTLEVPLKHTSEVILEVPSKHTSGRVPDIPLEILFEEILTITPTATLRKFIDNNKHLAVQGSEEWKANRMNSIGGSEIASVIGQNPYSTRLNVIAQKLALTYFNGNAATRWGNLFESMAEKLFKIIFLSCERSNAVYNIGSIQHKTIVEHKYSPDGLCVMTINGQEKIVLIEFKSPYGMVPTSKVPKHYLPQVKAGLCTIDIADTCIFVSNMFRKCTIRQLDFSIDYDTRYHGDSAVKLKGITSAIANGIIFLYIDKYKIPEFTRQYEEFIRINGATDTVYDNNDQYATSNSDYTGSSDDDIIFTNGLDRNAYYDTGQDLFYKIYPNLYAYNTGKFEYYGKNMIDFGDKHMIFNQMLELYKADNEHNSIISAKYMNPQINSAAITKSTFLVPPELNHIKSGQNLDKICKQYDIQKCIDYFIKQCIKKDAIPIGYLPWKLFRSSNIFVDRDPHFLEGIKDDLTNTIKITKNILANATTDREKATLLNKYFEGNPVSKPFIDAD
jgi:hypothetical protein